MNLSLIRRAIKISVTAIVLSSPIIGHAQNAEDLTMAENLSLPEVPKSAHNAIARHIEHIGNTFAKKNVEVKYSRRGEVADIIIPCSHIFRANQTTISPEAPHTLNAFLALIKLPTLYKIVIAVHCDDSGSEKYSDTLTDARANAIYDYLASKVPDVDINVVPYGLGYDEPRASNHSIVGRTANRRIEFYIVPEKQTIDMARAGKL